MTDLTLSFRGRPRQIARLTDAGPMVAMLAATLCFALTPWFARMMGPLGLSMEASALWRFALVAVVVLPFFPRRPGTAQQALLLLGAGGFAGLGYTALVSALANGPVAGTVVIYMSYPLMAALIAWLLLGDRPSVRIGIAGAGILLAAGLVAGPGAVGGLDWIAIVLLLPAPFSYALIIVAFARLTPDLNGLERLSATATGTVIALLPTALAAGTEQMLPNAAWGWAVLAAFAVTTAAIPQALVAWAAPKVSAAKAGTLGSMELPAMLAVGALLLGEALGPMEILAAALVLGGVLLVQTERATDKTLAPEGVTLGAGGTVPTLPPPPEHSAEDRNAHTSP